jgi:hypothetical protein
MKRLVIVSILFLGGCGPSPEDVCQHTFDLMKAEAGEAAANKAIGGSMKSCVSTENLRKDRQGMFKYKSNNECVMAAKDFKSASACSK